MSKKLVDVIIDTKMDLDEKLTDYWKNIESFGEMSSDERLVSFLDDARRNNDIAVAYKIVDFYKRGAEGFKEDFSTPVSCGCCYFKIELEYKDGKLLVLRYED